MRARDDMYRDQLTDTLIQGLAAPLHDLSRGCSVEEIIELALVASVPRQTDASRIPDSSTLVE